MRVEKKYLIEEVAGHLKKSDYVILANFDKMTVADVAELRQRLAAHKAEFHVVKNSSLRVAAQALEPARASKARSSARPPSSSAARTRPASPRSSATSSRRSRRSW